MISDIEEAAPDNSLIDLSNNEIEIRIKLVLIRDFPEEGIFVNVFYRNLALLYTSSRFVITNYISFCFKINRLRQLKKGTNLISAQPRISAQLE